MLAVPPSQTSSSLGWAVVIIVIVVLLTGSASCGKANALSISIGLRIRTTFAIVRINREVGNALATSSQLPRFVDGLLSFA
jgi:hypothetical protein